MRRARSITNLWLAGAMFWTGPAAVAVPPDSLPRDPSELLLVGDSVTAGVYFLTLSEASARQGWAGQLVRRLGIAPDRCPFDEPFPINHLGLTFLGFTVGGLAYPWAAIPALLPQGPKFEPAEERVVVAVPGQLVREVLDQSSRNRGKNSGGWTFAKLLLPKGLSAIGTIEQWKKRPSWVVLFIGTNDLLSSFGMLGDALPPSPGEFEHSYETLVARLQAVMNPDAPSCHFLVATLPDVTRLPMMQPLRAGARDGRGHLYPEGSMASAFLVPFRDRYELGEVWTPAELEAIRARATDYNDAIRGIANRRGLTVVDLAALLAELGEDPSCSTPISPYFSPDLHHPSFRTHARIADTVLSTMARVAGGPLPPPLESKETPLPHNGDFTPKQRARVDAMMHLGLLGLQAGPLPPKPTYRLSIDAGGQAGERRARGAGISAMLGIESTPTPVAARWLTRGILQLRASPVVFDASGGKDAESFPRASLEARAGMAFEPIGMWRWTRLGYGLLYGVEGGLGWYARGEWRLLYAEASTRGWDPDRIEAGLVWGRLFGRPGRNGN